MRTKATAILTAIALAFTLGACATDQTKGPTYPIVGTVDQKTLEQSAFAARAAYAGALHLMAQYVVLPRCVTGGTPICSSQSIVNDMRRYELAADTATSGAATIARSPTKTPLALANAVADAQRAVAVFERTVAAVKTK
jgi:hypothetical protein